LFFAHFVILFSLKKLSGAPLNRNHGFHRFYDEFLRAPAVFSCFSVLPLKRAQKKAASLTRDRFTTSKAIQEQQTHRENSIGGARKQENSQRKQWCAVGPNGSKRERRHRPSKRNGNT
jgi:hypothetical protein